MRLLRNSLAGGSSVPALPGVSESNSIIDQHDIYKYPSMWLQIE
jgi:hypothetical protein